MSGDPRIEAIFDKAREPALWFRRIGESQAGSKLGGLPWLPDGMPWPRHAKTGEPLHFLAQIDLGGLPKTPLAGARRAERLPESGLLLFFADIDCELMWGLEGVLGRDAGSSRVLFAPHGGNAVEPPNDLAEIHHQPGIPYGLPGLGSGIRVFPEAALEAVVVETFASEVIEGAGEEFEQRAADLRTFVSIERATGQRVPVRKAGEPFRRDSVSIIDWGGSRGGYRLKLVRHQMLGAGINVQGSAEEARAEGLALLLQVDTDRALHESFIFCDMGVIQFWIHPSDLEEQRFERAWATTEGG
jgi:uncharacterized protein YwqG